MRTLMRIWLAALLCAVALVLGAASAARAQEAWPGPYAAEVLRVIDGDSVVVRLLEGPCGRGPCAGSVWTIRLRGVDAPERHRCRGAGRSPSCAWCPGEVDAALAATIFAARLAPRGAMVQVSALGRDRYWGRMVADLRVMVDGGWRSLGGALAEAGLAAPYDPAATGDYHKSKPWCPANG